MISFVESTTGATNNGGNVTLSLSVLPSDYIVVAVTLGTSKTSTLAVASSSGGAYSQIVTTIASSYARFGVFRQFVSTAGAPTQAVVTGTGGSSDATTAVAFVFRGVSTGTPEEATSTSTTGASSTPDSPSITPGSAANQGFLPYTGLTLIGIQLIAAPTAPSGYFNTTTINANDTNDATTGGAWITAQSTAAFNPGAWTSSASASWCSATVLLRPDAENWVGHEYSRTDWRQTEIVGYWTG